MTFRAHAPLTDKEAVRRQYNGLFIFAHIASVPLGNREEQAEVRTENSAALHTMKQYHIDMNDHNKQTTGAQRLS